MLRCDGGRANGYGNSGLVGLIVDLGGYEWQGRIAATPMRTYLALVSR